jgi:SAM-dependent methyltransferase
MTSTPEIHLSIVQPSGYLHWMALLDQARYYRYQFRRLGARVTMAKNRLRHDAVNFVFGAHLGFDPALRASHTCLFVNLEQFGPGGATPGHDYLKLLQTSAVVDYDPGNVGHYARDAGDVPIAPFLHAPYLTPAEPVALEQRPIDLLFIGSMNSRRERWLARVEAAGWKVSVFNSPIYGEDRDEVIRHAKAVLNVHFYDSCRLEQSRIAQCLSLGTPVISERVANLQAHEAFEDSVLWLQDDEVEDFFVNGFGTPAYFDAVRTGMSRFEQADPIADYADLLAFAGGYAQVHAQSRSQGPWRPRRINLGSGKDYQSGWLNLDVLARTEPDLVLDLSQPVALPLTAVSPTMGPVALAAEQVDVVNANNVLEHVADLPALMTNCLALLKPGGEMVIEVPIEGAPSAWQDPTHVRAMNENSWVYYTEWFWYLGWYEHRFEMASSSYLDVDLRECARENAAFMRLLLRKIETSPQERMVAQTMQPGIRLPEDPVRPVAAERVLPAERALPAERPVLVRVAAPAASPASLRPGPVTLAPLPGSHAPQAPAAGAGPLPPGMAEGLRRLAERSSERAGI